MKDILALSAETGNNKLDQIMVCSEIGCVCVCVCGGGGGGGTTTVSTSAS